MREVLLQWTIQNERGPAIVDEESCLFKYKQLFFEGERWKKIVQFFIVWIKNI